MGNGCLSSSAVCLRLRYQARRRSPHRSAGANPLTQYNVDISKVSEGAEVEENEKLVGPRVVRGARPPLFSCGIQLKELKLYKKVQK